MGTKKLLLPVNYKPSNHGFPKSLCKYKKWCWTPNHKSNIHPFIQCLNFIIYGNSSYQNPTYQEVSEYTGYQQKQPFLNEEMKEKLATLFHLNIVVFWEEEIQGGKKISYLTEYGKSNRSSVALLKSTKDYNYFMLLIPDPTGKLILPNVKQYCNNCGKWRGTNNWKQHIENCFKCMCGKQYMRGDSHPLNCNKEHFDRKRRTPKDRVKIYHKEKTEVNFSNCYFADLETFTDGGIYYKVYAGGFMNAGDEEPQMFRGKDSLDKMMRAIIDQCNGVLWFFNGARFDNFFILKWLLKNKIQINPESTIITSNTLLSVSFKTNKGEVQIKDLCKFLKGSLASCCKAFGMGADISKSSFDHDKIKTWENVEEYQHQYMPYLRLDIIALKNVYARFAESMFSIYQLHVGKFMTITQLAYAAFSSTLSARQPLFRTPNEDEEIMREMYKGGRVICGRKEWRSSFWQRIVKEKKEVVIPHENDSLFDIDGDYVTDELYDEIDDYLDYIDANSLYPAAQVNRVYPIGKHRIFEPNTLEGKRMIVEINQRKKNGCKELIYRRGYCVDVECPNDLSVGFLMGRGEDGRVVQDLYPKTKKWFTGPELWEASRLGYKITNIHKVVEWEKSSVIFNLFVLPTYQKKKESPRDTPTYTCAKEALNGLTGKFGQRSIPKSLYIYTIDQEIDKPLVETTAILDDENNNELLAWTGYVEKETTHSPFPIHLSAFILAWARIYMSKMLRRMKLERSCYYAPLYGDTDSLIVHQKSFAELEDKWKGDMELGQMKKEIHGKIIAISVLSPKNYCLTYIDGKTKKILSIMKSKGIPHPRDPYNTFECFPMSQEDAQPILDEVKFLKHRRTFKNGSKFLSKTAQIGQRAYCFYDANNNLKFTCERIPPLLIPKILSRELNVECVFGGMKRSFDTMNIENIYIGPDSKLRIVNKTNWWEQGNRFYSDEDKEEYPTSYPPGHWKIKK